MLTCCDKLLLELLNLCQAETTVLTNWCRVHFGHNDALNYHLALKIILDFFLSGSYFKC